MEGYGNSVLISVNWTFCALEQHWSHECSYSSSGCGRWVCVCEKKVYVHTLAAALVQSEVLHPVAFLWTSLKYLLAAESKNVEYSSFNIYEANTTIGAHTLFAVSVAPIHCCCVMETPMCHSHNHTVITKQKNQVCRSDQSHIMHQLQLGRVMERLVVLKYRTWCWHVLVACALILASFT